MTVKETIQKDISENKIMVYIKGTAEMPQCGFSKAVIDILNAHNVKYNTRNVLESDEIRQGVKDFSAWPTIPQVFVNGEFIGGCDVLLEMHNSNELENLLAASKG